MNDLLAPVVALLIASISAASIPHTPAISIAASLVVMALRRSVYQGSKSARSALDFPWPCGPSRTGMVSTLQPGVRIRAAPEIKNRGPMARVYGLSSDTQIDAQPCMDSRLAVPGERIEIVLHGVKTIEARRSLDGATDIGLTGDDIFVLKPSADHRFMMIDQRPPGPFIAPVRALANDDAQVEFVVSEHALPGWVLAQK